MMTGGTPILGNLHIPLTGFLITTEGKQGPLSFEISTAYHQELPDFPSLLLST